MTATCQHCQRRPGTETWIGEGGMLGWAHGIFALWCMQCVLEAQIEHAQQAAERLPELKCKLAALTAGEPKEQD